MAHYEIELTGAVEDLIAHLDKAIVGGSASAKVEDGYVHEIGDAKMVVRVYERYSFFGGNRVSLNVSVLTVGDKLAVSAITAGGSKAIFVKINTVGEEAFLARAIDALHGFGTAARS